MAQRRYPPNRRLTWERLQRGWSYDELAAQITASLAEHGEPAAGLVANTVRRWETGERWPEPRFRKHLVLLLDRPASELGLLTPDELATRPPDDANDVARRILSMVGGDAEFNRQQFVRMMISAGLTTASVDASANDLDVLSTATHRTLSDARAVDSYTTITARHRELYWSAPAASLFESSLAHMQLGSEMMHGAVDRGTGQRLAAAVAESALLSARLAFFDLSQPATAQQCFAVSRHAAELADDHSLTAAIFAHMAFVPGFAGDSSRARPLLDAAHAHARYGTGPGLRSWLHCVDAEIGARTGDTDGSLRHVRQAHDSISTGGTDPVWLDWFDAGRLAGFTGNAQLLAGRYGDAATSLETALAQLDSAAGKQRSVVLFDLAAAHAAADADRAGDYVRLAFDAVAETSYATAIDRIPMVRSALAGTPYAAELEERTRALPPASG